VDTVSRATLTDEGANDSPPETTTLAAPSASLVSQTPRSVEMPGVGKPDVLSDSSKPALKDASSPLSWQALLAGICLSGSVWWLALAGQRVYRFYRLLLLTRPAPENLQTRARILAGRLGLARCPVVRVVSAPISPLVWALVGKPCVLVPASLLERFTL